MDDTQQQQTLTGQDVGQQQSANTLTGQQQTSEPAQGQEPQAANPPQPQVTDRTQQTLKNQPLR